MHFLALVPPVAALMASTAHGAECYSQKGAKECLNRNDLYNARQVRLHYHCIRRLADPLQDYCGSFRFQQNGERVFVLSRTMEGR